jgi:tetratricopeptide (TPR) repeat protein
LKAIPLFQQAASLDPDFAMAHAKLAEAYLRVGQYKKARAAVERALSLSETASLPLAERHQIHAIGAIAKDDYETAAKGYRELAKVFPDDPDVQLSLARSLERLGHLPEAIKAYQRVLEIDPGYGAALLGLGRVHDSTGNSAEATRYAREALDSRDFEGDLEATGGIHHVLSRPLTPALSPTGRGRSIS